MNQRADPIRTRARRLRSTMTEAEARLWSRLRDRRLCGHKFVRQWPIGPYVADFACRARNLVIEVDGSQHADSVRDDVRDKFLRDQGFRVLRFWNSDVLARTDLVLEAILAAIEERG